MNGLAFLTNACRFLFDRRTWWSRSNADITNSLLSRKKKKLSLPIPQDDPFCPCLHYTNKMISNRFTTRNKQLQETDKCYRDISYSESLASIVDGRLCLTPHTDHSKGQKQGHVILSRPCSNQGSQSLTGGKGYEWID